MKKVGLLLPVVSNENVSIEVGSILYVVVASDWWEAKLSEFEKWWFPGNSSEAILVWLEGWKVPHVVAIVSLED